MSKTKGTKKTARKKASKAAVRKKAPRPKAAKKAARPKVSPTPSAASSTIQAFCRQVRARSREIEQGLHLLEMAGLHGLTVGLLRQELDSLVRVVYMLKQTPARREELAEASIEGRLWKQPTGKGRITDKEMVDLAQGLHGWTQSVYRFGCAFIHLSNCHDYLTRDPFGLLPQQEQRDILHHMRHYHGGPPGSSVTYRDLLPYLPRVFHKLSSNLEHYVQTLEQGGTI